MYPLLLPSFFGISLEVFILVLLLWIPTFFLFKRLLKNVVSVNLSRNLLASLAALVSSTLLYIALVGLWIFYLSYYPNRAFNRQKWHNKPEERYELSQDLIKRNLLIGQSKKAVTNMLGSRENSDSSNYWTYNIGTKPGLFNIDPSSLNIEFQEGKVVKVTEHE
jgi:hypothetical protein